RRPWTVDYSLAAGGAQRQWLPGTLKRRSVDPPTSVERGPERCVALSWLYNRPGLAAVQDAYVTGLSQEGGFPGGSLWTIPLEMCSIVGGLTPISIDGGSPMSTITQRIASAFVVLCGRYGDVTKMAHDREQSRQSLYREASQVANAVDGTAVQSRIDELQRQLAGQQA